MDRSLDRLMRYSIDFTAEDRCLVDYGEGHDLIHGFTGKILLRPSEDPDEEEPNEKPQEKTIEVGMLKGLRVALGDALDTGMNTYDLFDMHSQELTDVFGAFFDFEDGDLKQELGLDAVGDLLLVEEMRIVEEQRGRNLGLMAMRCILREFGGGCALTVIKPFPLQYSNKVGTRNKRAFLADQKKLRDYWGQLGFIRLDKTDYYYLDMANRIPAPEALVRTAKGRRDRGLQ